MICSETSPPRLSFSTDLSPADSVPVDRIPYRKDSSLIDPNYEFEFSISSSIIKHETSPAEDLFSNGIILPIQIPNSKQKQTHQSEPQTQSLSSSLPSLPPPNPENPKPENQNINSSKSFWGFKRSSSLNCDRKRSSLCSFPSMLRSNSTGSGMNPKRKTLKDVPKQSSSQKQQSVLMGKLSSCSSSSSNSYAMNQNQKPPLRKNHGGLYGSNLWISPVLNFPPYVSKGAAEIFGLSSLFRSGKDKKSKK